MTETQQGQNRSLQVANAGGQSFSVAEVKKRVGAMTALMKDVMQVDVHYGKIPGTPKPTLLKPGAEKIGLLFNLAPSFKREYLHDGDHLTVVSECVLTHRPSGETVAMASGMCSSKETKYAFRKATRKCPKCSKETIIKGKKEYGGGWLCFEKKGGCGAKWKDGAEEIEGQSETQEENPNLADVHNTVLKMADKRAFVAATLLATAASDIFTQDMEDFTDEEVPPSIAAQAAVVPMITTAQHSRIAVLIKEKGVDMGEVQKTMQDQFGVTTRKALTQVNADKLIQWLQNIGASGGEREPGADEDQDTQS